MIFFTFKIIIHKNVHNYENANHFIVLSCFGNFILL